MSRGVKLTALPSDYGRGLGNYSTHNAQFLPLDYVNVIWGFNLDGT